MANVMSILFSCIGACLKPATVGKQSIYIIIFAKGTLEKPETNIWIFLQWLGRSQINAIKIAKSYQLSGQFITTSAEVTPNVGLEGNPSKSGLKSG